MTETSTQTEEVIPVYSPPEYQKRHKFHDVVETLLAHQQGLKKCSCGESFAKTRDWAEHLANVLYPYSGEYHPK